MSLGSSSGAGTCSGWEYSACASAQLKVVSVDTTACRVPYVEQVGHVPLVHPTASAGAGLFACARRCRAALYAAGSGRRSTSIATVLAFDDRRGDRRAAREALLARLLVVHRQSACPTDGGPVSPRIVERRVFAFEPAVAQPVHLKTGRVANIDDEPPYGLGNHDDVRLGYHSLPPSNCSRGEPNSDRSRHRCNTQEASVRAHRAFRHRCGRLATGARSEGRSNRSVRRPHGGRRRRSRCASSWPAPPPS